MRKITLATVLILISCLFTPFFASAAKVYADNDDMISKIKSYLDYVKPLLPVGYDYYFVSIHKMGFVQEIWVTNTPSISNGTIYYPYTNDNINRRWYSKNFPYKITGIQNQIPLNYGDYLQIAQQVSTNSGGTWLSTGSSSVYGVETTISTANFSSFSTYQSQAQAKGYDFVVKLEPLLNKTALQTLITQAKAKQNTGYTSTSWQALQTQITAAEAVNINVNATQAQVDTAKNSLQTALDSLQLLPDISALQALIAQAEIIQYENYVVETWNTFQQAIVHARAFCSGDDYTAELLSAETASLQAALDALELLPDLTELKVLIVEADAITDIGYTEPTWNRFAVARSSAHTLVARNDYVSSEVVAVTVELSSSISNLTLIPVDKPPAYSQDGRNLLTGDVYGLFSSSFNLFLPYAKAIVPPFIFVLSAILSARFLIGFIRDFISRVRR